MPAPRPFSLAVIVGIWFALQCAEAGDGSRLPEVDLAAPGAPLYEYAVVESVRTLMSKEDQAELDAEGRPPSPGPDYFWCEQCKSYHMRQPAGSPGQPAGAQSPGAASAPPGQPGAVTAVKPPSPGPDSYWCEQCKSYHLRQPAPQQQGGPSGAQAQGAIPIAGQASAQAPGGDYYYCDKCKAYHHRQVAAQHPVLNESLLFGGGSNAPSLSPVINPKEPEH
jgi:hypothetical protein